MALVVIQASPGVFFRRLHKDFETTGCQDFIFGLGQLAAHGILLERTVLLGTGQTSSKTIHTEQGMGEVLRKKGRK